MTTPVTHTTQQLHFNSAEFDDLDRYFAIGCAGYGSCHDAAAEDGSGGLSTREEIAEALPSEYEELLGDPEGWGDFQEVPYVGGLLGIPTNAVEVEKCGSLLKSLSCLPFLTIERMMTDRDSSLGVGNARTHMELAARLTADVGPERARELLDMHEAIDDGELHGHFRLDRQMDVINNDVGIQIRIEIRDELSTNERLFYGLGTGGFQEDATYSPQELDRLMDQAIESGDAVWITP